ncbi:hypothetical protein [Aeromonas schubertii]|uniref:Lipoprotein n=1 Tax=Aeromonas schubertii TaxID=652 RepID=A0ABS7V6C0_9GAMM|nr:hypothetical protein [Aeromonas schubertii]KUE80911.1 hypothetical protein ATO46_14390 [Aeromonas schubertii]MBZ6064636.1 hypothetical protein [Aeromonas schubertii]MBZ6073226.1 hypothetical protein [Aeromonas schubertii]QCG46799.1 hypothetical protein E2P79_02050 [Aeromonas schubertii]
MRRIGMLLMILLLAGCAAKGETPAQKRSYVQQMRQEALSEFYREKPELRREVSAAQGYALFSSFNNNLLLVSAGSGFGVVRDNRTGKDTYMRMAMAGVGLGFGIKDFRALILFQDRVALQRFLESGWEAGGQADVAARSDDKGAAIISEAASADLKGVRVYQMTKHGIALQATAQGYKYWPDDELNGRAPASVRSAGQ